MTETTRDKIIYRGFWINYDPPPIPARNCDWEAIHPDYDGPGDNRYFRAASEAAVCREVDAWYEEQDD